VIVAVSNRAGSILAPGGVDVEKAVALARARGDGWIREGGARGPREIFEVECDVFFACADAGAIDAAAAEALAARAVVPAANEPCAPRAEEVLLRRGILFLPDFVANSGGILGSFLAGFGLARDRLERFEHRSYRLAAGRLLSRAGSGAAAFARAAIEPRIERISSMPWILRKVHGGFYRLARAPHPLRRAAGEAALFLAAWALRRRFR
jgi:hypothetical protein